MGGRVHGWVAGRAGFWGALAAWVQAGQLQPPFQSGVNSDYYFYRLKALLLRFWRSVAVLLLAFFSNFSPPYQNAQSQTHRLRVFNDKRPFVLDIMCHAKQTVNRL